MSLPLNQVVVGDCTEVMRTWPADSIDLVVTSPPYWGLRDYGSETVRVWGGDPECEHEWVESESGLVHENRNFSSGSQEEVHGEKETTWIRKYDSQKAGFCIKCGAWHGSLGLEPHPQMFIDHLIEVCREIKRVLKPSGTFWLNLGDTYASMKGKAYNPGGGVTSLPQDAFKELTKDRNPNRMLKPDSGWLQPKQRLMIPARVAIALQDDGWILRSDVIWHKPNAMPSSVKDRLTNAYEHIFFFVKNNEAIYWVDRFTGQLTASKPIQYYVHDETGVKRLDRPKREVDNGWFNENGTTKFKYAWQGHDYYFDLDEIRQPHTSDGEYRNKLRANKEKYTGKGAWSIHEFGSTSVFNMGSSIHPKGKNPGDVWEIDETDDPIISESRKELHGPTYRRHTMKIEGGQAIGLHPRGKNPGDLWRIPTTPFKGAHFATFPPKLIEPIIKAGSPRWICSRCGKPRKRITEPTPAYADKLGKSVHDHKDDLKRGMRYDTVLNAEYVTTGWSDCGCGEKWVGGVVLDPFGGSGTVGQVARKLGRRFILIELVPEYADMARQRVRGKYKPVPEGVTQLDQFMEAESNG